MRALIGGIHYGDRGTEWMAATMMCGWAATLALPGDSFASPTYSTFDETGLGEPFWMVTVGGMGVWRLVTLYVNGRHPRNATFRRIGAAFGIAIWTQLIAALAISSLTVLHATSPGLGIYVPALLFECVSFWRAIRDVRYRR